MESKVKKHLIAFNNANCKLIYGIGEYPASAVFPIDSKFIIKKDLISKVSRTEYFDYLCQEK